MEDSEFKSSSLGKSLKLSISASTFGKQGEYYFFNFMVGNEGMTTITYACKRPHTKLAQAKGRIWSFGIVILIKDYFMALSTFKRSRKLP